MDVETIMARAQTLRVTQKDLAARAGLNETTVSLVFNDAKKDPRVSTLRKLNAALDQVEAETLAKLQGAREVRA